MHIGTREELCVPSYQFMTFSKVDPERKEKFEEKGTWLVAPRLLD
jgi:hypothetical protein